MNAAPLLIFMKEGETLKSQSLEKEVSIGRGEGNVIRLEDRAVSRKHAVVRRTEEGVHIEKQSDFAPIRLNGVECTRALLKEGDIVEIGPFRMRLDPSKQPAPEPVKAKPVKMEPPVHVEAFSDSSATLPIPDSELQVPAPMPTESLGFGANGEVSPLIGDFSGQTLAPALGAMPDLAFPIEADSAGADAGSTDPGTNIFSTSGDEEVLPLNLEIGTESEASPEFPEEILATPIDEDAATRIAQSPVKARIEIAEGMANVQMLPLSKDEIVLGRGKECDVVLNDKKSSRKNTIITRDGNHYRVKDLDSSNGTFVNNTPIKDVELSADDVIRIGDVEIRFIADSDEYQKRKAHFIAVEPPPPVNVGFLAPDALSPFSSPASPMSPGVGTPYGAPIPDSAQTVASPKKGIFAIYDKYFRNFKTLKPMQKLLVVLSVALFVSWYLEEDVPTVPNTSTNVATQASTDGKPRIATDYDGLPAAQRAQIDEALRKATDFLRLQDFDKAIYEIQQRVYPILSDYPQAKEIERYAQEGKRRKDALEEEAKRKESEAALKVRIADLEVTTRDFMAKRKYDEAKESFSEILSIDPDNTSVSEWRKEIETWMEDQDRILKEKQVQEEINKRAWDTYNEGFELHKAGKYREAVVLYKRVPELGADDTVLLKKASTMVKASLDSIRELREPHIIRAKKFETDGDLAAAFKEYQIASEVDPLHPDGWAGMDRIRDILTDRAKILYTEAVIAESYSDFKVAQAKFNEIMQMAPEGSLYYQRAQRKLQSYLNFKAEETL